MSHSETARVATAGSPLIDLSRLPAPPAWTVDALCAQIDLDGFFPEKGGSTRAAKRVCGMCPVAKACLDYALDNNERFGIWGGVSERDRRKMLDGDAS